MTLINLLIGLGLIMVGFIIGWVVRAMLPISWPHYDTLIRSYIRQLTLARIKARTALAMWDNEDPDGARRTLVEIVQLGKDKQ